MDKLWSRGRLAGLEIVETLLLAAFIFFASRLFIQNFRVEGRSMYPGLQSDELVLVSKFAYLTGSPRRGDVVVISRPANPEQDLVKRIIGMPGETVEIVNGKIYLNGIGYDESEYIQAPGNQSMASVDIPDSNYFVLGDNRVESEDSRRFGTVPSGAIVGKVWAIYWPLSEISIFPTAVPEREPLPILIR